MAHYQAGPPPLPHTFWQAPPAGPSQFQGYQPAPQHPGAFMGQPLGPPPPAPPPPLAGAADGRLRSVDELPAAFRPVFPFRYFNAIQNESWPTIYEAGHNVVIAAPTGGGASAGCCPKACARRAFTHCPPASHHRLSLLPSNRAGKTVLLELAILRLLSCRIAPGSGQWAHQPGHLKSVYLAPSRALVQVGAAGAKRAANLKCCPKLRHVGAGGQHAGGQVMCSGAPTGQHTSAGCCRRRRSGTGRSALAGWASLAAS